jgi:hypothetical protein
MSNLEVHHGYFRSHSGDDSEDNLITLCGHAHAGMHCWGPVATSERELKDSRNPERDKPQAEGTDMRSNPPTSPNRLFERSKSVNYNGSRSMRALMN